MAKRRSTRRNGAGRTLRNTDLTDRELLANITDAIEADGWATTTGIAVECGFRGSGEKGDTPARKAANRLAWMRDGGLLESTGPDLTKPYVEPGDRDTRWRLTEFGQSIRSGALSRSAERALEGLDPGAQVVLMRLIAQQGYVNGDTALAFTLRREWQHNQAQRKLMIRGR